MLDSSQLMVKLLARLPLSPDLAVCICPYTNKAPSFVIFYTEKHTSVLLRGYLKALILYWLTQHCWKAAPNQLHPRKQTSPPPSSDFSYHLSEVCGNQPADFGCTNGQESSSWRFDPIQSPWWEAPDKTQWLPPHLHCRRPRMGREEKQLLQRASASPGSLWSQFSSRSNGHHQRQQRIFFFTLNSLNKRPFMEEHPVAHMLFYNKGPTGRGYTNPAFFPL